MEEMYEVLKFIEHGNHCRQSLDCVHGTILMRYLKDHPRMEKRVLLGWFRELASCVDQYHRARNRQNYRYLNPCSIVVTDEGSLLLLDLESPGNAGAVKQMQKGAVRDHFVKPVYEIGVSRDCEADLFAYGKTIQFMLAYTEIAPKLSGREELRLKKVIERCTGESGKKYEDFGQVLQALPCSLDTGTAGRVRIKRILSIAAAGVVFCLSLTGLSRVWKAEQAEASGMRDEAEKTEELEDQIAALERERDALKSEQADWKLAGKIGASMKGAAEVCLAADKRLLEEELLLVCGRLLQYESDPAGIEAAGLKKMELEAGKGDYEQAVLTGETLLAKIGSSEKVEALVAEYKAKGTGEDPVP